jgi:hypothetical protein
MPNPITKFTTHGAILQEINRRLAWPRVVNNAVVPRMKCVDGFAVSVQASNFHYCQPRSNAARYVAVELGFPTAAMPALARWAESWGDDDPEGSGSSVWGYVPIEEVATLFLSHGGLLAEG